MEEPDSTSRNWSPWPMEKAGSFARFLAARLSPWIASAGRPCFSAAPSGQPLEESRKSSRPIFPPRKRNRAAQAAQRRPRPSRQEVAAYAPEGAALLLRIDAWPLHFVRRAFIARRRSQKQLLPVRKSEVAAVGAVRSVLGLVALDDDFVTPLQRIPGDASAQQNVGAARLDRPVFHRSVVPLHVHMNPTMWINQLHLGHRRVREMERLLVVKLGRERMVRLNRQRRQKRGCQCERCSHHK